MCNRVCPPGCVFRVLSVDTKADEGAGMNTDGSVLDVVRFKERCHCKSISGCTSFSRPTKNICSHLDYCIVLYWLSRSREPIFGVRVSDN